MAVIIVSGSGGWIGRRVCQRLVSLGHAVVGLDRPGTPKGPCQSFEAIDLLVDGGDSELRRTISGALAFIHCAGYAHRSLETPEEIERFFKVNRDGTQRVLAACIGAGVPRFVYLGSIAAYEWKEGVRASEDSPLNAETAYAKSKLEGEASVMQAAIDWRVARLATVFGDGDRANFSKLAASLRTRRFVMPGNGAVRKSVIPVDLAAELICDLALRDTVPFRLVNFALPTTPTLSEIVEGFVQCCGFAKPVRFPISILNCLAMLGDGLAWVRPNFPLTTKNLRKLTTSTEVDVSRLLQVFPERTWPTFSESLAGCRDWYKAERQ